jgi:cytochrome bd-type quinol oxidase subunit 2
MSGLEAVTPRPGRLDRTLRSIEPRVVAAVLLGGIVVIGVLGAWQAAEGPVEAEGGPAPHGFLGLFYLDGEYNVPALFSAALWLLASLSLYAAGQARERGRRRHVWTALAIGLIYLALDEAFGVHEKLEARTGVDWQLLYLPLLVAIAAAGLYVLIQSRGAARRLFLAAGAAAFVAQVLEAVQWDGQVPVDSYRQLMVPEEILEPTAAALLAVAGLMLLRDAELPL